MSQYLGKNVSHVFGAEGYNYSKVVFNKGRPILDAELNLMQDLQGIMSRRATIAASSGWLSKRDPYTGTDDTFRTQDPKGAIPEVALVNGWPLLVTNTATTDVFVNTIDLSAQALSKGSRVDGVFLEAWSGIISEEFKSHTQPGDDIVTSGINGISAVSASEAWAVGDDGILLHTDNTGVTWLSKVSPTSVRLNAVHFLDAHNGYILGNTGMLFRTDDAGASWTRIPLSTTEDLLAIAVVDSTNVWVSGRNGTILRYSGVDVSFIQQSVSIQSVDINGINFYNSLVGWACCSSGAVLRTINGGSDWSVTSVTVQDSSGVERAVTTSLNAIRFVNLNDGWVVGDAGTILRTTDGGLRWGDTSSSVFTSGSYGKLTANLRTITVLKNFPLRINLSLYPSSSAYFRTASYSLSATTLDLRYTPQTATEPTTTSLALADYATDELLRAAIEGVTTVIAGVPAPVRVFSAMLGYLSSSYESHATSGSFLWNGNTDIQFSMGDLAWIGGDAGTILSTTNSGAQWVVEASGTPNSIRALSFANETTGWATTSEGTISVHGTQGWSYQDTALGTITRSKVYASGNLLAASTVNLNFDSISPEVLVTTADRAQIQYRIRVVEGVDISAYQEAGLGSTYTFSQGPNASMVEAGSFGFESMGPVNGDFGLWRARCRNTVDGYTYAIPMFLVSRRNSDPYDVFSNINGSTNASLGVLRPDGLVPGEITLGDIVDIRKTVSPVDYGQVMQSALDNVLSNSLKTRMGRSSDFGSQVGASILHKDAYLSDALTGLASGTVNSSARGNNVGYTVGGAGTTDIIADTAGELPTPDALTFSKLSNGIWHHEPALYSATYAGTGDTTIDGTPIPGGFTGLGTVQTQFVLGATGILNGASNTGLIYRVSGEYVDYSFKGLSSLPSEPVSVRNLSGTLSDTAYYRSISSSAKSTVVGRFPSAAVGYEDFVEAISLDPSTPGFPVSSAVRMHLFLKTDVATQVLAVPKDSHGYASYSVEAVINAASDTLHLVSYVKDRNGDDTSNLYITLEAAFKIPAGSVVEVILGVNEVPVSSSNSFISATALGIGSSDRGETADSFANSNLSIVTTRDKAVDGFYRSVLVPASISALTVTATAPAGALIIGMAALPTTANYTNYYAWYTSAQDSTALATAGYTTVMADMSVKATGFGTNSVTFDLMPSTTISLSSSGTVMVALYIKEGSLVHSDSNSSAEVYYRSRVPQTLDNLPSTMELEVLNVSPNLYVSNLGQGGGIGGTVYENALEQIPVNDTKVSTESFYFNLSGLKMAALTEEEGLAILPMSLYRTVGGKLTVSNPSRDNFGRTFYQSTDVPLVFKAAPLTLGNPRKIFVPMLVRVTSSIVSPVLRGEVLLAIVSKSANTELENTVKMGSANSGAALALYRVQGMPLIRG